MKLGLIALAAVIAVPAAAQIDGPRTRGGCLDVADARGAASITARGIVSHRVFAGAPNFESVRDGDAAEPGYILTLPTPICVDDGGEFADPKQRFREIQVFAKDGDPTIFSLLRALVGHRATVIGLAMPAQTGHHHRPLLIEARSVSGR